MFNRKLLLTLLMLFILGTLAACGGEAAPEEPAPQAPAEEEAEAPAEEAEEEEAVEEEAAEEESTDGDAMAGGAFAGETIEIIIPYGEGGGSDTWMRAITPFLQKNLGDDVVVQPINMPGASGVQGANEFGVSREHDGLSLLVSSGSNVLPYLLGEEAVQYDFADFTGVLGSPVGGVVYTSPDTGITDVAGLCAGGTELVYGGISPTGLDLVPLLSFELMGLDFVPILGYDGRGAARVAFEQGEINLDYQTSPAYLKNVQPLVDEGSAIPLFAFGILDGNGDVIRDPVFSDLPSFAEAYETCTGAAPSGTEYEAFKATLAAGFAAQKNLWIHGDAPQERIDEITAAAEKALADPEFKEVASNLIGDYDFYVGANDVNAAFGAASQLPQESFDWLVGFLDSVYDVAITIEAATEVEQAPAMAEVDATSFAGETIEIIIPYGEGGGSDTWMRAIAPFLQKQLGDEVVVQPINMPGASGVQGANEFGVVREHDGLSLLVSSGSNVIPYLLGEQAVQYDFADFTGVLGSPVGGVVYTSPDTGITDVAGLCAGGTELVYGGISPTGLDMVPLLAFELMGVDFIPILGYDGRGAARVAFEQGEINLDYQTSPAYLKNVQPLVDEGSAIPLFAFGILDENGDVVRDPVFSDMPSFAEAYETCTGSAPSGTEYEAFKASLAAGFAAQKNLWIHGDAPQERIDAITAAAQNALADPEFKEVASNLIGDYEFYVGASDVNAAFGAASQLPQESFDWLVGFLANSYDVQITADAATEVAMAEVDPEAFAGETIEIIIPYGEGGGSDTWMRAIAPFLQKYLGDQAVVQPINMPGASGVQGANEFGVVREHDGLSLLVSSGSNVLPYLLGEPAVQYDFAEFSGVMGSPVGGVVYVSPDTGITDVAGLCAGGTELVYGGISPTGLDMVPLLGFELLNVDFIPILGYDGRGAARVAFEQGEINLDYQTSPAYLKNVQPLVDEGSAIPLFAFGVLDANGDVVRDPVFADMPSFAEAYETCNGAAPEGTEYEAFKAALAAGFAAQKNLWVHGDAPQERIDALVAAAQLTLADPEFAEVAGNLIGDYAFYAGAEDVDAAFGAASQLSPEAFDWLVNFLVETYQVELN
ncbi:MAG: hypothetical protein AAF485_04925 [Chloroflexota bacterium]